jgi:hypothetical protein
MARAVDGKFGACGKPRKADGVVKYSAMFNIYD